jgi:SAM-dependent methyltransferase
VNAAFELAAVEAAIDWHDGNITHRNRLYSGKINFRRDILPGTLSVRLPDSDGEWVSEEFPAGELVPAYQAANIHTVKLSRLKLHRKHGPPLQLQAGRFYPRYLAAGVADIHGGNIQPMRVTTVSDDSATLDLNHPLAQLPITLSARIDGRPGMIGENGGSCNDVVMNLFLSGAGLERDYADNNYLQANQPLTRMDEREDALFYSEPRLVQHIDAKAIELVTDIYARQLKPGMRVLDLMSSWVSHLPKHIDLAVSGLGMNAAELAKNEQLADYVTQDLNSDARLPWPDNHFDAVVCTVSVEYLTNPVAVFREVGRVLRPGAPFMVTFSDRWFPTKAVDMWSELHPFERMALVQDYFQRTGGFAELSTESVSGYPRPADDPHAHERDVSDPVFAVSGRAASG